MYLCYIDESGTPDVPGNTSHFVLAGLSIPIWMWKSCDEQISSLKKQYGLEDSEIHVAWMLRAYPEQRKAPGFEMLGPSQRRAQVQSLRVAELLRLQRSGNPKQYHQTRKNYQKTRAYVHLSYDERKRLVRELAGIVSGWGFARLFAECVDKLHFDPSRTTATIDEQAFEQVVSRFERYLKVIRPSEEERFGLLIHDNNPTVAKKHTEQMRRFHRLGTLWTKLEHIIETPLFVDSALTSLVQVSDLCSYALRRYLENGDDGLFDLIFQRADRKDGATVGVRHFTSLTCSCKICESHRSKSVPPGSS